MTAFAEPPKKMALAALPTPFSDDGAVSLEPFMAHVKAVARAGLDGVFIAGSTGEGPLPTDDEIVALTRMAASCAPAEFRVIAHVGRPSSLATILLARRAQDAGATAVAAVVPYYYQLDHDQIMRHYRLLCAADLTVPIIAYAIPKRTNNDFGPTAIPELAEMGIAGVKDSTGSMERHLAFLAAAQIRAAPAILTGTDSHILESFAAGSAGSITAVAAANPDRIARLRDAYRAGDMALAEKLQMEVNQVKLGMEHAGRSPTGIKRVVSETLALDGIPYPTRMRAPLSE